MAEPHRIADLHCHYPMKLVGEEPSPARAFRRLRRVRPRPRFLDKLRGIAFKFASRNFNYPEGWRVTFDGLEDAGARLVLSVLYEPFAEIDFDEPYGAGPESGYFAELIRHLEATEEDLRRIDPERERHLVVKSAEDLEEAERGGRIAFVHCVEGGFHLGEEADVPANVAELATRGVGYVTLAHLFYRQVATNAPALPMFDDGQYNRIWCQPKPGTEKAGLAPIGEAAVRAMFEHKVLVDLSHMRGDAFDETLDLLDQLDPGKEFPVVASHAGYQFGEQDYMLTPDQVRRVAERRGVIGLILAQHQLEDGLPDGEGLGHTVRTIKCHVDEICEITDSHAHVGIGSDLDGFIKPTMPEIERAEHLAKLVDPLREHYGTEKADAVLYDNAAGLLKRVLALRGA